MKPLLDTPRSSMAIRGTASQNARRTKTKYGTLIALSRSLVVLFLISAITPSLSDAQSLLQWAPPQRIRGIADDAYPPYLVADQNQTVHAFYSQWTGSDLAVFYNQWTPLRGWTNPVDILLSPNKNQATALGAVLDSKGLFHVIFFGGIAEGAEIYYSKAPAVSAGQARSWLPPKLVGVGATPPASGSLLGDDKGKLFVLYAGGLDGYGVYEVHSIDGGASWSDPIPVFLTQSSTQSVCCVRMYLSNLGWLHAIWNVVDIRGQGRGIYYARLNVQDLRWSFPVSLAETPAGLGVHNPAITEYRGHLFASFYDADLGGHDVMRISDDNGQTWQDPVTPFPQHIGANGPGSFVVGSDDELHLFWGERIPGIQGRPDIHGMWHSLWLGDKSWSAPEPIVSGPRSPDFDPSFASAVVSQGNVLLLTWRQDPGPEMNANGVWYSHTTLNASELPLVALPTLAPTLFPSPTTIATPPRTVPSPTRSPLPLVTLRTGETEQTFSELNPNVGLLVAVLPVLFLLSLVVVLRRLKAPA